MSRKEKVKMIFCFENLKFLENDRCFPLCVLCWWIQMSFAPFDLCLWCLWTSNPKWASCCDCGKQVWLILQLKSLFNFMVLLHKGPWISDKKTSENKGTTACTMSRDFEFWKVACQRLQTCTPGMFILNRELLDEDQDGPGLGFWILSNAEC